MGYKCNVCCQTFTRSAYMAHMSVNNCRPINEPQIEEKLQNELPCNQISEDDTLPNVEVADGPPSAHMAHMSVNNCCPINEPQIEEKRQNELPCDEESEVLSTSIMEEALFMVIDMNNLNDEQLLEIVLEQPKVNPLQKESGISEITEDVTAPNVEVADGPLMWEQVLENGPAIDLGLTKKGAPRKRAPRRNKDSIPSKRERQQDKHPLQNACNENLCKRKCIEKICEDRRKEIYNEFWSLDDMERKLFILGNVDRDKVAKRTTKNDELPAGSRRNSTFYYYFNDERGDKKIVCKRFFLGTLGYGPNNDKAIFSVLNSSNMVPKRDMRGKNTPPNKIDEEIIENHILRYNPSVSHYRREHAPLRKYLPSEINIITMYNDFKQENSRIKCSYEKYRNVVSKMNISFTVLGHEECEKCEIQKNHDSNHYKNPDELCNQCQSWLKHKKNYTEARKAYQAYVEKVDNQEFNHSESRDVVYSMDLQKVLMLPMIEQFKEVIFTKRIVVFNESFAPLGTNNKQKPIACIWHEGCSGRKKNDITSALHSFFLLNRDAKHIVLWMDNCASQNKNWALFSYLVWLINSSEIEADTIEFNYLEAGHTFMSADSFHHQVTKKLKQKGKVYDFADFSDAAVRSSNGGRVVVAELTNPSHFFLDFDYSSTFIINKAEPRPYLSDIVNTKFIRGSLDMRYKVSHDSEDLITLSFLKKKYIKNKKIPKPSVRTALRGVNKEKIDEIIKKLVPLMPENRQSFWRNLPVSDTLDLVEEVDD